jgi:hypothetical protein
LEAVQLELIKLHLMVVEKQVVEEELEVIENLLVLLLVVIQ